MPAVKESVLGRRAAASPPLADPAPLAKKQPPPPPQPLDIIDIRDGRESCFNLKDEVASMLNPVHGPRKLPTLLLYDEKGLQMFEEITYLDEYYLTNYEIELLKQSAAELASKIPAGAVVVELGSGNLRKVCLLLQALEDQAKPVDYYALDLSQRELERTLAHVPDFRHVACHGLLGTYDDGREWLKQPRILERPKCILHIGSSIGNFHRDDAADFLQGFSQLLRPERDVMIVGVDSCCDPDKVYRAYNDSLGLTHEFYLNGLAHANEIYGEQVFRVDEWKVVGEYVYDRDGGRHQAFLTPLRDMTVLGAALDPHERIQIEQSLKYSKHGSDKLWKQAGLSEVACWRRGDEYGLHILQRATLPFYRNPSLYATAPLPSIKDWEAAWEAWDAVTRDMLPRQSVDEKPIKLRHACIFYLGHIPTFLDIQLSKATGEPASEPSLFPAIFERGIDPDVDNPEHCHAHSAVPDEWPAVDEIADYQVRVRARLRRLYGDGGRGGAAVDMPRHVARAVWVGFEHELMHLETLLYMMLQSDKTLPPPNAPRPDFALAAEEAARARVPNQWFDVPAQTIAVGMDDPEDGTDPSRHFGWDNEKPARTATVHAFQAQGRPITNEEYAQYLYNSNIDQIPASWSSLDTTSGQGSSGSATPIVADGNNNGTAAVNGSANAVHSALPASFLRGKAVCTVYGLVPLAHALDWPVFASIYAYVDGLKKEASTKSRLTKKVPAVNGHLVNDGVEETPPTDRGTASPPVGVASPELFADLSDANVGFRHWHPVPVTADGGSLGGRAAMGGLWEWTSSPLCRHPGFEPMSLYPAYTADFFDGKHNIVLGGSWATHPRIAGRKSFVNWYQRNYPYAWAGARLVRDLP
ncbi:histidine-specific methyltransferase, SAM-dependent domain-containing protein [Hirsutella rhossiliensis]|uniref:Histidine-specific methyltransferase, SAM-dependent domain-containing protein n=1 Tax=Hirsutella rhossiliensis TaxID=111463 RepID=A0A9P8MV44_9HYPO|nr:histidine-specific methyltransferase, SAM-dependent domain-containing protein [Hirsutella rhossiliensis]KAH0960989.1 histidine-specific methyltransferase, SAM-dependent domain-containing protein [Hirsutella rhossiliensis]